jgi:hypothetical protein
MLTEQWSLRHLKILHQGITERNIVVAKRSEILRQKCGWGEQEHYKYPSLPGLHMFS